MSFSRSDFFRTVSTVVRNQHGVNEAWCGPQCHFRRPTGNVRQTKTHRFPVWAEGLVLPLTVQHLDGHLVQVAAVHLLALPPLQGKRMFALVPS